MTWVRSRGHWARGWVAVALSALALAAPLAGCGRMGRQPDATATAAFSSRQAAAMLKVLADAPSHGFAPSAFPTTGLQDGLKSSDEGARAAAQARLTSEVIAYAKAQHGFSIPRAAMDKSWGLRSSAKYDAAGDFRAAVAQNRLEPWLVGLAPQAPQYELLRRGYQSYLNVAQSGGWPAVPEGPTLKPGARGARVAALRQRLAFEDASVAQAAPDAPYDSALAQAVAGFQQRHGLHTTGALDAPTLAALNVPAMARAAQLRANLERWRWAPRQPSPTRIEVNSSAGTFDLYLDGQPAMHMLVATGKPGDETPIVASKIHTVVFNPTWNVPSDIAANELMPKGGGYLSSHHFVQDGDKLVQQAGPDNALGQVKFLFDNPYSVYLHDTPSRAAFAKTQRSVSHGCVRLERAVDLAKLLLSREAGWPPERVDQTIAGAETISVPLKDPIPVGIFYWTAFVEGNQVSFRDDVYGWDAEVLRQLDAASATYA
ncbi:MAG: murein L,D-transpeptidase [Phenylobacterium sp.]|nr:murein L,D-transpeptidase [Phenylobacterium sp.]